MSIRYGKYCGVGHGGCEGEKPCDALDACCEKHDTCAMKFGAYVLHEGAREMLISSSVQPFQLADVWKHET